MAHLKHKKSDSKADKEKLCIWINQPDFITDPRYRNKSVANTSTSSLVCISLYQEYHILWQSGSRRTGDTCYNIEIAPIFQNLILKPRLFSNIYLVIINTAALCGALCSEQKRMVSPTTTLQDGCGIQMMVTKISISKWIRLWSCTGMSSISTQVCTCLTLRQTRYWCRLRLCSPTIQKPSMTAVFLAGYNCY